MSPGQCDKIKIRHMLRAGNAFREQDSVVATQIIINKKMSWIRDEPANYTKRFFGRLSVSQHCVSGNTHKSNLTYRARGKTFDGIQPSAGNAIMIMIFP
jgi:hypothetical protein